MDEYKINFDLDSKIAWNRHFIREQFEKYKKIENYYALFLAYLGFIGVFYFDCVVLLMNHYDSYLFIYTLATTISIGWSCYYMFRIISLVKWKSDDIPTSLYCEHYAKILEYGKTHPSNDGCVFDEVRALKLCYLETLEGDVRTNKDIYKKKKSWLNDCIKIMFLSLIVYSINIISYKQIKYMCENKEVKPSLETPIAGSSDKLITYDSLPKYSSDCTDESHTKKKNIIVENKIDSTNQSHENYLKKFYKLVFMK